MRLLAVMLIPLALAAVGRTLAAEATPSAVAFPRILNCYAAGLYKGASEADIRRVAQYDLLCGGIGDDAASETARVRQLNPRILILPYVILRETGADTPGIPDDWWARDSQGQRFSFWPGTYVLNLLKKPVQDWLVGRCERLLADPKRFDGIFLDGYDPSIDYLNHDHPGDIDLDSDGKRDDPGPRDARWRAAEESVIRRVSALRDGKAIVMANTWAFPRWVPKGLLHGVLAEDQIGRVRDGKLSLDQFLSDYQATAANSRKPNVLGIVNGGSDLDIRAYLALSKEGQGQEQGRVRANLQRMRFGLCAALMGDGYYGYDLGPHRGQHWWYPEYAKIGAPTGPAKRLAPNQWLRRFRDSQGRATTVLVNGAKEPLSYQAEDGKRVSVPPMDGALLR